MRDRDLLRVAAFALPIAIGLTLGACSWDVGKIFDRDDPNVEHARHQYSASLENGDGDIYGARDELEEVLRHHCESDGGKDLVVDRPFASLDLGLVIFRVAELVGRRFGEEEWDAATPQQAEQIAKSRAMQLDCAHLLLQKLADDPSTNAAMALKSRYLLGNFEFLARHYQKAIDEYDRVLVAHPARGDEPKGDAKEPDDDDAVARDAAWNRAIAIRRLEDQKDAGSDGGDDSGDDSGEDASEDAMHDTADAGADGNADGGGEGGSDGGGEAASEGGNDDTGGDGNGPGDSATEDSGLDAGGDTQAPATPPSTSASKQPPPKAGNDVDLRELNRFENQAPLDLDMKTKLKERKQIPKAYDK